MPGHRRAPELSLSDCGQSVARNGDPPNLPIRLLASVRDSLRVDILCQLAPVESKSASGARNWLSTVGVSPFDVECPINVKGCVRSHVAKVRWRKLVLPCPNYAGWMRATSHERETAKKNGCSHHRFIVRRAFTAIVSIDAAGGAVPCEQQALVCAWLGSACSDRRENLGFNSSAACSKPDADRECNYHGDASGQRSDTQSQVRHYANHKQCVGQHAKSTRLCSSPGGESSHCPHCTTLGVARSRSARSIREPVIEVAGWATGLS